MLNLTNNLLIYTDLDGSLLDHDDYSWQVAKPWLERLIVANIPVIIISSKTAAEISQLQQELGLEQYPFIAENGAQIVFPTSWKKNPVLFSADYINLCKVLKKLREETLFNFTGFSDIDDCQLAKWTGLPLEKAQRAKQRTGSEPILWYGDDIQLSTFRTLLACHSLKLVKGGRFCHILANHVSKGRASCWLTRHYHQQRTHPLATLGFGDAQNDVPLLCSTDYPVLIRNKRCSPPVFPEHCANRLYRTQQEGPAGWCEGLEHFLLVNARKGRN
jgi:mannosyl-3-phosphoglycerate phosphatase